MFIIEHNNSENSTVNIRMAQLEDAEAFLHLRKHLADETAFLLRSSDEILLSVEAQWKQIHHTLLQNEHLILLAEKQYDKRLVRFLMSVRRSPKRTKHVLTLVIGVLQMYVQKGIGTLLFSEMEGWASKQGIHRLELHVLATNQGAIAFYTKQGFQQEGVMRHAQCIEGNYIDAYLIAKIMP